MMNNISVSVWKKRRLENNSVSSFYVANPVGIGELLRQQREDLGLSLEQVSKRTLIHRRYLEALEAERWDQFPGKVYAQNFLKRYAQELNIDSEGIVKVFQKQTDGLLTDSHNKLQPALPLPQKHFWDIPRLIKASILAVVIISFVAYLVYSIYSFVSPPQLAISSPQNKQMVVSSSQVVVKGVTEPEAEVRINGQRVPILEGRFEEVIDLQRGLNTITIRAKKKYSKPRVERFLVVWTEESISKNN